MLFEFYVTDKYIKILTSQLLFSKQYLYNTSYQNSLKLEIRIMRVRGRGILKMTKKGAAVSHLYIDRKSEILTKKTTMVTVKPLSLWFLNLFFHSKITVYFIIYIYSMLVTSNKMPFAYGKMKQKILFVGVKRFRVLIIIILSAATIFSLIIC